MKQDQDYIQDIAEMRSLMERSSKFLSLSGLAGVMAGIYALAGAFICWWVLDFNPVQIVYGAMETENVDPILPKVIILALVVLILAVGTAVLLSTKNANRRNEKIWSPTAKRLLMYMAVPLVTGGLLILILISYGLIGLVAPVTLIFYGLALFSVSMFTYEEVKSLGLIQLGLGLLSAYFVGYALLFWAVGFGVVHIIYGIYMHYRYER